MICIGDVYTEKQIEKKLKEDGYPIKKEVSDLDGDIVYLDEDNITLIVLTKYSGGAHKRVIAGYMADFCRG